LEPDASREPVALLRDWEPDGRLASPSFSENRKIKGFKIKNKGYFLVLMHMTLLQHEHVVSDNDDDDDDG